MQGSSTMAVVEEAFEVFYCYAYEDEHLRKKLEKHLSNLERQGFIKGWHAGQIIAGAEQADAIDHHLNTAPIILLLISSDFMHSDGCYAVMKRAMERHDTKEARVVPIRLRPTELEEAPFGKLQVLPANAQPATTWKNEDEAFADVAAGIRKVVEELRRENASGGKVFIELLNKMPEKAEIIDFLSSHPSIMRLALGSGLKHAFKGRFAKELLWSVSLDQFDLDCCTYQKWPTANEIEWHIVFFDTLSANLFFSRLNPVQSLADKITSIKKMRWYIQNNLGIAREKLPGIKSDFQAIIVAGRRSQLSETTKTELSGYNRVLVGIKIRTYDWIVDAAIAVSTGD